MSLLDLCLVFAVILLAVRSQIQAEVIRDFEAYMLRMEAMETVEVVKLAVEYEPIVTGEDEIGTRR